MRAQPPPRTLLSLALALLFLSMSWAKRGCSSSSPKLLSQLKSQANITGNTASLLEPYILHQNLNTLTLRAACTEHPVAFPSEDMLRQLSKPDFLSTVHATLGRVWHQLGAFRQQFPKIQDFPELERARQNIQGIRNNVYCMARLLHPPLEIPEPTQADSGTSRPTTTAPGIFQIKIDSCRFLWGYHRFMGSVGRVFEEWGDGSRRSRRHSPLWAWLKGDHRIRPSRSSQSAMLRSLVPR
ncbi:oncostatin-M precursor [Rattus norvegicus]|uniref:Oncostatin-M n=2 Tax=Rattus norvegicus TaxID=10116 RepID=ONCM_RAT|nr:oncostatin-M precursor [Rattus norvegicus]Q65Z15.1 RecName: Full=Oncostatin-M; Short=OSM; Flags: Precursor [Rattus norvegicus]BAD44757.1 oncostatin M [Rattus norvegicus]|eukprot:NP_001006962.1 oncostatin-M precursor [Rattus norvegicus]